MALRSLAIPQRAQVDFPTQIVSKSWGSKVINGWGKIDITKHPGHMTNA